MQTRPRLVTSIPFWVLLVLSLASVIGGLVIVALAWRLRLPVRRWATALLAVELVQIAVGLYQARNGLPELAVGVHMVLACLLMAAMTAVLLSTARPRD